MAGEAITLWPPPTKAAGISPIGISRAIEAIMKGELR
jgi:hypothetical protein